jgi:hypothetical protein
MWPLDETTGTTANDATGTGHTGAYVGGVALGGPGSPKNGNAAATFSGGDVTVPYSADLNPGAYTVEAWVNPSSVNTYMDQGTAARSIVCSRDDQGIRGWMLYADNYTGTPQFALVVGAESSRRYVYDDSGTPEQTDRWYHVAGSYDGTNLHLYVNGVEVTSAQLNDGGGANVQPNPSSPLEIGSCNGGRAQWAGAIQDVTFWNGALDPATIAAHASGGTPPPGGGSGGGSNDCDPSAPRCTQGGGPQRPLILIPGTLGSYIGKSATEGVLWPPDLAHLVEPGPDYFLQSLSLDDAGGSGQGVVIPNMGAGGLVGEIKKCFTVPIWPPIPSPFTQWCPVDGHHYDTTVSKLVDLGYTYNPPGYETSGQTLFTFPYDWRNGMFANASLLRQRVKQILALTHAPSVDILAHSQGGLIANFYLHASGGDIHRVVTVGTPYVGATKFLGVLNFHMPCEIQVLFCLLSPSRASQLVRNFPGSLELLPSRRYWDLAPSPLVESIFDINGKLTSRHADTFPDVLARLGKDGQNVPLIQKAAQVHVAVDAFPASTTPILRCRSRRRELAHHKRLERLLLRAVRDPGAGRSRGRCDRPGRQRPGAAVLGRARRPNRAPVSRDRFQAAAAISSRGSCTAWGSSTTRAMSISGASTATGAVFAQSSAGSSSTRTSSSTTPQAP